MLVHPELALAHAHERHRELVEEADRYRLLTLARRYRRTPSEVNPAARGRPEVAPAAR